MDSTRQKELYPTAKEVSGEDAVHPISALDARLLRRAFRLIIVLALLSSMLFGFFIYLPISLEHETRMVSKLRSEIENGTTGIHHPYAKRSL